MTKSPFAVDIGAESGYVCPRCNRPATRVKNGRRTVGGYMRRRRHCTCGHAFTTVEVPLSMVTNLDDSVSQIARETRHKMDDALRSLQKLWFAVEPK